MKQSLLPLALVGLLLATFATGWYFRSHPVSVTALESADAATPPALASKPAPATPSEGPAAPATSAPRILAVRAAPAAGAQPAAPADAQLDSADELLAIVQIGRVALSFVGVDEGAEEIWLAVINDPMIDPEARKDLIEDLNEDGFADPKNITREELPLIEARLALIEKLAPDAMDDANAEAFKEAHKDLTNMRAKLLAPVTPAPATPPAPDPAPHPGSTPPGASPA